MSNSSSINESSDPLFHQFQSHENRNSQANRKSLLTEESFKKLSKFQEEIFSSIEMTPSFRKIINALISEENLAVLRKKFLDESSKL
jgi:hypothetical protein